MHRLTSTSLFNSQQHAVLARKGIRSIGDLLQYIPRRYIDRSNQLNFSVSKVGDSVSFIAKVAHADVRFGRRRRLVVRVHYERSAIDLIFFQAIPYYKKVLTSGVEAAFFGKIDTFRGSVNILHPEVEILTGDELVHTGKIIPIYRITDGMQKAGITSRVLRAQMHIALEKYVDKVQDILPENIIRSCDVIPSKEAFFKIHFPESSDDVDKARKRLALDELLVFTAIMNGIREKRQALVKEYTPGRNNEKTWGKLITDNLPFDLTKDQTDAGKQLHKLIYKNNPFSVLLQGDVGSGKTLVALLAAMEYLEEGIQVAMMAPTEILARQHYRNFINYIADLPMLRTELVLGAEKASDKKARVDRIKRGDSLLVVGTHSLIQKDVDFHNLGLVIIDEQHRFGVEQREALQKKGQMPDLLSMSATPIPRSLTLTLYGDLEQILIKEKPPGRKLIDTRLFKDVELDSIYRAVKKYVDQGRQAYIVYPVIEETQKTDWASVMSDYSHLENEVFKGYRLGLLHGKLSTDEKDRAMEKFKDGSIQILVTTTVVEVGVDVANANIMMIRNAEKFGLSQLHQLRGRVGRGEHQSFCILVQSAVSTQESELRLAAMLDSNDGFYLAQKDFEIRGSGELLNTRQAGISEFKIVDLRIHFDLAQQAKQILDDNKDVLLKVNSLKNLKSVLKKGLILFVE